MIVKVTETQRYLLQSGLFIVGAIPLGAGIAYTVGTDKVDRYLPAGLFLMFAGLIGLVMWGLFIFVTTRDDKQTAQD